MPSQLSTEMMTYSSSAAKIKCPTKDPVFLSRIQDPGASSWINSIHCRSVQDITSLHMNHLLMIMTWASSNHTRRPLKFQITDWLEIMTVQAKSLKKTLNLRAISNAELVKMKKVGSRVSSLMKRIWRRNLRETLPLLMRSLIRIIQRGKTTWTNWWTRTAPSSKPQALWKSLQRNIKRKSIRVLATKSNLKVASCSLMRSGFCKISKPLLLQREDWSLTIEQRITFWLSLSLRTKVIPSRRLLSWLKIDSSWNLWSP